MPKQKVFPRYSLSTDVETGSLEFRRQTSEKVAAVTQASWDLDTVFDGLSEPNQERVRRYGMAKLLADRTSSESDSEDRPASINTVIELLETEDWEKTREGGPGQPSPLLVQAAVEANKGKGLTPAAFLAAWAKATKEQREVYRERYAERVKALKAEVQTVELDDLA